MTGWASATPSRCGGTRAPSSPSPPPDRRSRAVATASTAIMAPGATAAGSRLGARLTSVLFLLPALVPLTIFGLALIDLLGWSLYAQGRIGGARTGEPGLGTYLRIF